MKSLNLVIKYLDIIYILKLKKKKTENYKL